METFLSCCAMLSELKWVSTPVQQSRNYKATTQSMNICHSLREFNQLSEAQNGTHNSEHQLPELLPGFAAKHPSMLFAICCQLLCFHVSKQDKIFSTSSLNAKVHTWQRLFRHKNFSFNRDYALQTILLSSTHYHCATIKCKRQATNRNFMLNMDAMQISVHQTPMQLAFT